MDQTLTPRVSVLMSVHNGQTYLRAVIDSILAQTLSDFEFIIVDDASTDDTATILSSYSDPRIHILRNETNLGLAASLNRGAKECRAPLIARMDDDDVAEPNRLEIQMAYLNTHPEIGVLGSTAIMIDGNGRELRPYRVQPTHMLIKWRAFFGSPMVHPSVMVRREIFENHRYNESFRNSQDFELWSRLLFETSTRFENLMTPLLRYRIHASSTTATRDTKQKERALETSLVNIRRYVTLSDNEARILRSQRLHESLSFSELRELDRLYHRLADAFIQKEKPTEKEMRTIKEFLVRTRWNLLKYWIKR